MIIYLFITNIDNWGLKVLDEETFWVLSDAPCWVMLAKNLPYKEQIKVNQIEENITKSWLSFRMITRKNTLPCITYFTVPHEGIFFTLGVK